MPEPLFGVLHECMLSNRDRIHKTSMALNVILQSKFLAAVAVLNLVSIMYPLSQQLQTVNTDLIRATANTQVIRAATEQLCMNSKSLFPWGIMVRLA